jgi:hypothetical protein
MNSFVHSHTSSDVQDLFGLDKFLNEAKEGAKKRGGDAGYVITSTKCIDESYSISHSNHFSSLSSFTHKEATILQSDASNVC